MNSTQQWTSEEQLIRLLRQGFRRHPRQLNEPFAADAVYVNYLGDVRDEGEDRVRAARQGSFSGPESLKLDMEVLSKRKELAKTQTQELLEEQTRRAEYFYLKARDYFKAKDFYNAIQYCEQAIKAHDGDARCHSLLGQSLSRNPDYKWQKRAEQSLLRAVEIDPWNAEHFVQLGNFYRSHNLLRKAKKAFQKAAEVMPSHTEALKALREMENVEA